jgi:hypothetical protein
MDLVKRLLISCASFPEAEIPEEEIRSTIKYIMSGRDYKAKVERANLAKFTFLPPYDRRWQPRPMNTLDRFLSGGWKKGSWEAYTLKEDAKGGRMGQQRSGPEMSLKRRVTLSFFGALLADIALSFIIWLSLMMGISLFGLESKLGVQIDAFKLLVGTFAILFVLLFLGFLLFIRPKKMKL